ncbi:MAG TPA: FAD-binding oxidoreductase [Anaerolineales bacterium]|nr:FAD-binding oxidoreductase [Anaerolineales bacterium]
MDIPNLRWWGWGTLDRTFSLEERPRFWPTLRSWLDLPEDLQERPPVPLEEIDLRPSRLDDPMLASLRRLVGEESVRTDRRARIEHACGKAYRDLVRVRAGQVPNPPDAVVYPADEGEVVAVLAWAADRDVVVIPFGGGSTVLGAVEPLPGDRSVISVDMARLDRLVMLDRCSWVARIQAGATGPEVETQLGEHGFTLGHFPQSFEFSTLGGWIATRGAGQTSTGYGKIEQMTLAVRMVTPVGVLETREAPAVATGPCLLDIVVGSEGAYGIITEATMRIRPRPQVQDYRGFLFRTLEEGIAALRDLMQHGPPPTIARLSDAEETAASLALAHEHRGLRALIEQVVEGYLARQGYRVAPDGSCFLLLGYDGVASRVARRWRRAEEICRDHGGFSLGRSAGESWKRDRFAHPYLRDLLLGVGVMVDTVETATSWAHLLRLYEEMTTAIRAAVRAGDGGPGYVMTHISHIYAEGASLYTTFLGRQIVGREVEQWWEVKRAATEAILSAGGTLSHHHGIGRDHVPWLTREVGPVGVRILRVLKETLDPAGVMNPGVLGV